MWVFNEKVMSFSVRNEIWVQIMWVLVYTNAFPTIVKLMEVFVFSEGGHFLNY